MPPGERDVSVLPCGDAAVPVRPRVETDGTALPKRFEPALTLRIGYALASVLLPAVSRLMLAQLA